MAITIAFDNYTTANRNASSIGTGATHTWTSIAAASSVGAERVVILGAICTANAGNDYTACTIDGVTATRVGTVVLGAGGTRAVMTAYRAAGTANDPIDVVATNGVGTNFGGACLCWKVTGAGTLLAETHGNANDPTLSVNTVTDGAVLAGIIDFDGGSSHTWTGLTEVLDGATIFANDRVSAANIAVSSGATPRTISVNIAGTPDQSVAALALSFNLPVSTKIPRFQPHYKAMALS